MAVFGSLTVLAFLVVMLVFVVRWKFLHREEHSRWLDLSAGTALAYVFVYLLPKLASSQEKFTGVPVSEASGYLRHHMYLVALIGLVTVYWLETTTERALLEARSQPSKTNLGGMLLAGGYGLYFLQLGYLLADMPRPEPLAYLLVGVVLMLHALGMAHGLRSANSARYDASLRWLYSVILALGWLIGIATQLPATVVMFFSAFTAGAIIIIAIREELPRQGKTHFPAFLGGAILTSMAALVVQELQTRP